MKKFVVSEARDIPTGMHLALDQDSTVIAVVESGRAADSENGDGLTDGVP